MSGSYFFFSFLINGGADGDGGDGSCGTVVVVVVVNDSCGGTRLV